MRFELGQKVRHPSSGAVGVIAGRVEFTGEVYEYAVQLAFTGDGKFPTCQWLREAELEPIYDDETTKPAPAKRGRKPKSEEEPEAEEEEAPEADETEEAPEEEETDIPEEEEAEELEADSISDDDMRERGARFIKKQGPKGAEKLKAQLAKFKAKNLVAVPAAKRESFLKALGA